MGTASQIARALAAWLVVLAILGPIGCAKRDDTTQTQDLTNPPPMPQPTTPLPQTPVRAPNLTAGEDGTLGVPDQGISGIGQQMPGQMRGCGSYWDPSAMWSQLHSAFYYGSYTPYGLDYNPVNLPRGLKGRGSRGLSCMNSLLSLASYLNGYSNYYAPGALQNWLWSSLQWSYRNPNYLGGAPVPLE